MSTVIGSAGTLTFSSAAITTDGRPTGAGDSLYLTEKWHPIISICCHQPNSTTRNTNQT
jgi:hypothetical protein